MHSKTCLIPFSPTWLTTILHCFNLDTVYMPLGCGRKKFLYQAVKPTISWPEARAEKVNDSEHWAHFIYKDIICRFGCIPLLKTDGGSEFKGAVDILFKQYGIVAILLSPYPPQANRIIEQAHKMLMNSMFCVCSDKTNLWPTYLHPALAAYHCIVLRVTGYTLYFLLYGQQAFFAFEYADCTWDLLDWHAI